MLSLVTMISVVPATAFHGSPYVLTGTAALGGVPLGVWDARLEWGGNGAFRLSIVDPNTNLVLVSTTIIGRESLPASFLAEPRCAFLERVSPYVGYDLQTGGVQDNCLSNGQRYMQVTGTYSTIWSFDVSVGAPFG